MKNIFLSIVICFGILEAQNSISGSFSPAKDYSFAFVYKATPSGADYIDRARLDETGSFTITLDSSQQPGMYKLVYAIPPEENNFDFIYDAKEDVVFDFNAESGILFKESNENKIWASYIKSMGMINQTISNYYQKDGKDPEAFKDLFKTLSDTQKAYEDSSNGMIVQQLIKANKPYIPKAYEDLSTYSENLKKTYFNNIDFDNEFLQSSSFITDRLNGYVFGLSENPSNEDYQSRIDDVYRAIKTSQPKTQSSIFQLLWNEFSNLNNDEVSGYIADTYLMDLAMSLNDQELISEIESQKRIAIGALAPDFSIVNSQMKTTLHELEESNNYLLIFWSSGCSHCMTEVPQVHQLLKENPDIKVIAYALEEDQQQWENAIKDFADFIHVFGPKKWDNPIVMEYSLSATPTYFILDSDKKIIAKPYDLEALKTQLRGL